jgi:hypothetical protein
MPNSRKRFSKNKKSVKKSKKSRKNTRKHKKNTPRRKYKKSSKRFRFFGGNGDEDEEPDECSICLEFLTNGEPRITTNCNHNFHPDCIIKHCKYVTCFCPMCRTQLNPNPNPSPEEDPVPPNVFAAFANNPIVVEYPNLYRVEFFKFQQNPSTGEIEKVKISVHDMDDETINSLNGYFMEQIPGLTNDHLDFFGDPARINPNGYINLYNNLTRVEIPLGDIEITIHNSNDIETATITQTNTHN